MFMQRQVCQGGYFALETTAGTEIVPADVIGRTCGTAAEAFENYLEGKPQDPDACIEYQTGWLARMSAPGYMDCTEWSAHATQAEAEQYLQEMYGPIDDEDLDTEDGDAAVEQAGAPRHIETFKCATGAGWGILVDGQMDTDIPYHGNEGAVAMTASCKYEQSIVTTSNPKHYSHGPFIVRALAADSATVVLAADGKFTTAETKAVLYTTYRAAELAAVNATFDNATDCAVVPASLEGADVGREAEIETLADDMRTATQRAQDAAASR